MLSIRKILVPVDFSDRSTAAARHAAALACRFESELIFFHVTPFAPAGYAGFEADYYPNSVRVNAEEERTFSEERLETTIQAASVTRPVHKIVSKGRAAEEIAELAKSANVDLIVMPTHGYGPFRRFILGSVTAKVLHDVECAVLTGVHVPEVPAGLPQPYRRVACAIDLSPHSEKTLRWATAFADAYTADLALIFAAPPGGSGRSGDYIIPEWREVLLQAGKEQIDTLVAKVGCQPEVYIEAEQVTRYVPEAAREFGADLLVIGRSPHNGLLGRLRTNAYALIRDSPCPVVSV